MISPLLNKSQLAEILGVTEWTIWSMRRRHLLPPAIKVGKSLRWRESTVATWIQENEKPSYQFDAELCLRAEKAAAGRGQNLKKLKVESAKKIKGRPTKAEQIAKRDLCNE